MINIKSEKGSITTIVLVTIISFMTVLSAVYGINVTLRKSQLKSQISLKSTYEEDLDKVDEIYEGLTQEPENLQKEFSDIYEVSDEYTDDNGDTAVIPSGYAVCQLESANTIEKGLVITDEIDKNDSNKSIGNEWVWVPVSDSSLLYQKTDEGEEKLLCGNTGLKTSIYSKSAIIIDQTRTVPGYNDAYREPDLVTDSDALETIDTNNGQTEIYYAQAGFNSVQDLAEGLVLDYKNIIDCIRKYNGFYIGRYELTSNGEKQGETLTNVNWYQLYKKCRNITGQGKNACSTMILGCLWDATCDFITNYGDKKSVTVSSSWGNYADSVAPANTGNYERNRVKNTGSNENWKANNIYDFAGNYIEYTQEAYSTKSRSVRGGVYDISGAKLPANYRGYEFANGVGITLSRISSRAVLWIN